MQVMQAADEFLAHRRIAVTGVSRDPEGHGGNTVYRRLRERGYDVVAINPNATEVEGDPCYPDLRAVPDGVEAVVIAAPAETAEDTIRDCLDLGINQAWMHGAFGPGSVSSAAAALGRDQGMTVIDGGCPLMFEPCDDGAHRVLRRVLTWTGKVPREV